MNLHSDALSPGEHKGPEQDEAARLEALRETGLLDSEPEEQFDELVHLASYICDAPISLISLVDAQRQWFKARVGLEATETTRDVSFCSHAIKQDGLFVVQDALEEPRFSQNALVQEAPYIRFYAGYPLTADTGEKLGTLCVIDRVPRTLTAGQKNALEVLARQVMNQIQLKRQLAILDATWREKELLSRQLASSEARFRGFMEASPAGAFIKDQAGKMVYCNQALTRRQNVQPEQWIGKDDYEIWPPECARRFREEDIEVLAGNTMVHFDNGLYDPDGQEISWSVYKFPFSDESGERFLAGVAIDVTSERRAQQELQRSQLELQRLNVKLEELSLTDGLTQIMNRRGFEDSLEREFERYQRYQSPLSLMMLDVDRFKQFNDAFGHLAGDEVLKRIAKLVQETTRKTDIVARFGGEEFIVLLPDTCESEALLLAQRVCSYVAADDWPLRQITVSIGVGALAARHETPHAFVQAIDEALYAAKAAGRNQVCIAETGSPQTRLLPAIQTRKERTV